MVLERTRSPLKFMEMPTPVPKEQEVLVKVLACGVCRTDLHVVDGELKNPHLPLILGHQIVGEVIRLGSKASLFSIGDKIGIPWLASSCNHCPYCLQGDENLCERALYRGYQINGGYAEYCTADERFSFPIPNDYSNIQAAPLLCAGLIGYRAYRKLSNKKRIGFYGFGSSAHLLIQLAIWEGKEVYTFSKKGDNHSIEFAQSLGATWSGNSFDIPPVLLDGAIIFAPVGELIPQALKVTSKGAIIVSAGIHMSDIPSFPYHDLWGERVITSVANLTRKDGEEFLKLAPQVPIHSNITTYPLEKANQALNDLRHGKFQGSAVLIP
ncbi:zinc-dependent alcohol dehydrogenase family protein [Chlamydiales bacterium]|nr:zinc-dependent alcohol dehydrogenase family protein [Chlamydiales bacterium]